MYTQRLRKLYVKQLDGTRDYLSGLLKQTSFLGTDARRLAPALTGENLESLVDALEEILSVFAIYGVARDFERLKATKALFVNDNDVPTKTVPNSKTAVLDLDAALKVDGAAFTKDKSVTNEIAYRRYFGTYIDASTVWQNASSSIANEKAEMRAKSGVDALYERYPLLGHAVKTITDHYKHNIELACERVAKNWDDIQGMFSWEDTQGQLSSGRTIEKLSKIQTTGNDFHKGGKQVLILTFGFTDGSIGRLVYKPSSVEIDCRIVGNSKFVSRIRPEGYTQDVSLTELINKYNPPRQCPGGYASRPLPSYKFLPYTCTSVSDAYGYIEFLAHDPPLKLKTSFSSAEAIKASVGDQVATFKLADVGKADWITNTPSDGQTFYHAFGGLMAMAMVVSLCDLHVQNVIVHNRLPHLIDLEEALKGPFTKASDTYLPTTLDRLYDPGGNKFEVKNDRTSDLSVYWGPNKTELSPAASVLYLYKGAGKQAEPLLIRDDDKNRRALVQGFTDMIETLAIKECNDAVKKWVQGLGGTIARLVTWGTANYAAVGRELYQKWLENSPDMFKADTGYNRFNMTDEDGTDRSFFGIQVRGARSRWNRSLALWNPAFAVEHPDHAWRDYLNCDVPSFYHKLGDRELLNSNGKIVQVAQVIQWQNLNIEPRVDLSSKGWLTQYLPETPIDMVTKQLDDLMEAGKKDATKRAFLKTALEGIVVSGGTDLLKLLAT